MTQPKSIRRIKDSSGDKSDSIEIVWQKDTTNKLKSTLLRKYCPCADCEELRVANRINTNTKKSLRVIKSDIKSQCDIIEIKPVGNYAITIIWGDGHKNGIYTFTLLRKLCDYIEL